MLVDITANSEVIEKACNAEARLSACADQESFVRGGPNLIKKKIYFN